MAIDEVKDDGFKFFKLAGAQNYREWSRNMTNALQTVGVWGFVIGIERGLLKREAFFIFEQQEDQNIKQNIYDGRCFKARGRIVAMCTSGVQIMINSDDGPKKVWDFLKTRFEPTGWANKWAVMNRFEELHYDEIKGMVAYNGALTKLKQEIIDFSISMEDAFVIKILNKLFPDFHTFLAIKNNEVRIDKKLPGFEELMQHLEEEENRLKQEGVIGMARVGQDSNGGNGRDGRGGRNTRGGGNRGRGKGGRGGSGGSRNGDCINCYINHELGNNKEHCPHANKECRNCKKMGHIEKNCRQEGGGRYGKSEQGTESKDSKDSKSTTLATHIGLVNFNAIELTIDRLLDPSANIWILDSGATQHCSSNKSLFRDLRPANDVARTASGEILRVEVIGNVPIELPNGEILILANAHYLPKLTSNLISTSCLHHRGFSFTYPAQGLCNIFSESHLVAQADMINNAYILRSMMRANVLTEGSLTPTPVAMQNIFAFAKPTNDLQIWHRRFAHLGYQNVIKNASKVEGMDGVHGSSPDMLCELCMKGRQQAEISRVSQTKAEGFLTKIHVDIGGSLSTTWRGNKIFVLIKCDGTGMLFIYSSKLKSQIYSIVVEFRIWAELQSGKKLKIVKFGGELLTNAFNNWFKEIGVQWEQSAPNTPQQNPKIERVMYIVILVVRSVMKDMRLPLGLWDLIAEGVVYTKNRTVIFSGSGENAITLYEAVNGVRPDVSNLRALGCRVYTHVPKTISRHKLDDRSWKGIHVGYGGNNQWKIYNSRTRRVHLTRDVRFDENYFYYEEDHASSEFFADANDELEVTDFWASGDDDELDSESHRRRVTNGANDAIDSGLEEDEDEEFAEVSEDSLTQPDVDSNSSDLNDSAFGAESERFQASPIPDSPIPEITMVSPRQIQPPSDSVSDEQLEQSEEIWENESSVDPAESPVTIITRRKRTRRPASPIDRETRIPKGKVSRPDYKKLQISRQFQSKGRANVVNNTYNAKQVSGFHIHMVRALHALNSGESFGLGHISESLNYREARKSPHWKEWKTVMETEVISLVENGIWKLVKRSSGRAVITGR